MSWHACSLADRTLPARRFGTTNIAPAHTALGKDGVEEINGLILHVAKDYGFADIRVLSSDTTAQELPIGYPNEPGILRGLAQRCGRALARLKTRAVVGVDTALAQVQTILKTVKEHHLFAKGTQAKRQVLTRLLTEVGQLVVQTRLLVAGLGERRDRVTTTRSPPCTPCTRWPSLIPQIVQWITTGVVAKGKIVHAGVTQARAIVRHKAGKDVEFGLPYLLSRLGGGYVFGTMIRGVVDESKMPLQGPGDLPHDLWGARHPHTDSHDGAAMPQRPCRRWPTKGSRRLAFSPRAKAWRCRRGRPRDGAQRAGQDRRHHRHPEDGHIWVQ